MSLAKWVRRIVLTGAALAAALWLLGSFASRRYRTIRMTALVPAGAELGNGTAIAVERARVGSIAELGQPVWGIPLEVGMATRHRTRSRLVLAAGETASAGPPGSELRFHLDASDSLLSFSSAGPDAVRLERLPDSTWIGHVGAGTGVLRNGHAVPAGGQVHLVAGDVLTLAGTEVRLGPFGRFLPAEVRFTTRKLCSEHTTGIFPGSAEQARCRRQKLSGTAELELSSLFGLTKPVLKLTPSEGDESPLQPAVSDRLYLDVQQDVLAEARQLLASLNSPVTRQQPPRTRFEATLAKVDSVLDTIPVISARIDAVMQRMELAMRPGGPGLASLVFRTASYRNLDSTLARVARITKPLADTGTLVQNAGLGKIIARLDHTMDSVNLALQELRGHANRLVPRIELAVEGASRTIEGAEGTLVALKGAAEDIQSIKRGAQAGKSYAVGGGLTLLLSGVLAAIASVVFIIP